MVDPRFLAPFIGCQALAFVTGAIAIGLLAETLYTENQAFTVSAITLKNISTGTRCIEGIIDRAASGRGLVDDFLTGLAHRVEVVEEPDSADAFEFEFVRLGDVIVFIFYGGGSIVAVDGVDFNPFDFCSGSGVLIVYPGNLLHEVNVAG